jgi:hypothetical protein
LGAGGDDYVVCSRRDNHSVALRISGQRLLDGCRLSMVIFYVNINCMIRMKCGSFRGRVMALYALTLG